MSEAISSMLRKAEGLKKGARNLRMRCYPISSFESDFITKLVGEFLSDLVVELLSLGTTKDPGLILFFCALLREHERHESMVKKLKN